MYSKTFVWHPLGYTLIAFEIMRHHHGSLEEFRLMQLGYYRGTCVSVSALSHGTYRNFKTNIAMTDAKLLRFGRYCSCFNLAFPGGFEPMNFPEALCLGGGYQIMITQFLKRPRFVLRTDVYRYRELKSAFFRQAAC